ncbi:MAG TPA: hypothetical protein PKE63_06705 [Lacibacter sp.]|nr:hypothetical protein [Lacibacter sp.]HMO87653.1 hypothetical protein [Lacibacter sp.]HMP86951.1 hypothetical protein [Lacibacter sp.]
MKSWCFIACFVFLYTSGVTGQGLSGQWEGQIKLGSARKAPLLQLRLEWMNGDSAAFGMLYTRGYNEGTVFGCDYIVTGGRQGNTWLLRAVDVQRKVDIEMADCLQFHYLRFNGGTSDTVTTLQGSWVWVGGEALPLQLRKTAAEPSYLLEEEIDDWLRRRHDGYDAAGMRFPPEQRWKQVVKQVVTPETEVVLELRAKDSTATDSMQVLVNGNEVISPRVLRMQTLRIRLQLPDDSDQELQVVNRSLRPSVNRVVVTLRTGTSTETLELECTGSRTPVLRFRRKGP